MIHFNRVTTLCHGQTLFQDISFFLPKASYTCVYGEDGAGKSSLLRMIAGELLPNHGTITVNGMELQHLPADRLPYYRRQIGWVESQPTLLDNLSTSANVRMPLEIAGLDRPAIRERTAEILELLGLAMMADVPTQRLTADQRWLVLCARATVHRPAVVLIDEPAVAISDATADKQRELTAHLTENGTTTVVVTDPSNIASATNKTGRLELTQGRAFFYEHTSSTESHQ